MVVRRTLGMGHFGCPSRARLGNQSHLLIVRRSLSQQDAKCRQKALLYVERDTRREGGTR